jgi:hypothetical protein
VNQVEALLIYATSTKKQKPRNVEAYGTSDGAVAGWDTRGRNPNAHAQALKKAGFGYRGKDNGMHKYTAVTPNPRHEGGFGKNLSHSVWVDPGSGKWAHEAGFNRSNMAQGRGRGGDASSLNSYLSSGKYQKSGSLARTGQVWNKLN